ncbi:LOW QUALITY PROTEIN: hypothetical protein HID58_086324 [Brassica napus]|uniref:Terpene synthase metal-binding domain-containing protein n=1 Tax=Brassica napus TaxID=3708 RepID=A0ABQ7XQ87_BRANA|nr:LOW QUALITY PROTEIN: hypothetical protein HID58_086324 [Brassica napus]
MGQMDTLGREIEALKPQVRNMFISFKGIKKKILFTYLLDEIVETLKDGFQKIGEMMAGEDDLYTSFSMFSGHMVTTFLLEMRQERQDSSREKEASGFGFAVEVDPMGNESGYESEPGYRGDVELCYGDEYDDEEEDVKLLFWGDAPAFAVVLNFLLPLVVPLLLFRADLRRVVQSTGKLLLAFLIGSRRRPLELKSKALRFVQTSVGLRRTAHMGTTTDYILDEALTFTLNNLESLSCTCKPNLSRLIRNSLDLPQHKNMEILVAEEFIRWYKEQDFHSKLAPYYRDILVELDLHTLTYLEPKLSRVSIFLTKFYTMQIILDDTCDRYASFREVEILVDIFGRWDLEDHAMDGLPDYLKSVVKFVFGTFQEFEREIGSELGGLYSLEVTIEYFKIYMRSNLQLAKWASVDHLPSFEEYLDVAGIEIAVVFTLACVLMAMENICKEEAYEWLKSREKLVRAMTTKARVPNDMFGYEDDMSRGYLTGSVNCYKKQYGVSEEEAFRKLRQLTAEIDKMMDEELLKPINVPRQVLKVVMIDTLRAINVAYDKRDGFNRRDGHLKNITSM